MQTKFGWIPFEQMSTVGLTKSVFVHYSLVKNSKKSNLKVFNYKNEYQVKSQNFACILI
jgi:hypothetical protein